LAEVGVQVVERWILARLRRRTFFMRAELDAAIAELLVALNERPFQKLPGSRRSLFEQLDRPALKALPAAPYEYAEWRHAKLGIDYHIEVDKRGHSVPHGLVGEPESVRLPRLRLNVAPGGPRARPKAARRP
jgi:hypothetical protein